MRSFSKSSQALITAANQRAAARARSVTGCSGVGRAGTVSGSGITGHGGPSQELALGFALAAEAVPGACMYAMDSEGTDGTSLAAGGITDSSSAARAAAAGVDLRAHLRGHASFEALEAMGDVVITGNTGTNLCDLNVLYVPALPEGAS